MRVLEAQVAWEQSRATRKDSPNTRKAHERDIRGICRQIVTASGQEADPGADPRELVMVRDLTGQVLRAAFAAFSADHARSSIARAHSTWTLLCRFCVAEELLRSDPMLAVARPSVPKRGPKPLSPVGPSGSTEQTAERLVQWLLTGQRSGYDVWPERDRAVILLLLMTGVRSAEACGLNVESLNGEPGERRLTVTGKGMKTRFIPVEEALYQYLAAFLSQRQARFGPVTGKDPLLVTRANKRLTAQQLSYLVRQNCRGAGIGDALPAGALVHALRHTYATLLAQNGTTATELMSLLGHASLSTSQGYIDASARELRSAAAAHPLYRTLRSNRN